MQTKKLIAVLMVVMAGALIACTSREPANARLLREATTADFPDLARDAILTADGQHIVFMMKDVSDVFLLDLQSGKLAHTERHPYLFSKLTRLSRMVAPDGSAVVYPDGRLQSLPRGRTRTLKSFGPTLRSAAIGFASNDRLLVYQGASQRLELIDTSADESLWSMSVTLQSPTVSDNDDSWGNRATRWSPRRDQFAWWDDGRAFVVNIATGSIREVARIGKQGADFRFSPDGSTLLIAPYRFDESRMPVAQVVDLASGRATEVDRVGPLVHFDGQRGEVFSMDQATRAFVRQRVGDTGPGRVVRIPGYYVLSSANDRGIVLGEGEDHGPVLGLLDDDLRFSLWRFSDIAYRSGGLTPDGRYVVMIEGSRVDLYDSASLMQGAPKRRSVDIAREKRLSAPQAVQLAKVTALIWAERSVTAEAEKTAR